MTEGGRGEWRPNDMRLWTKEELLAEIRRLEAWVDDRESLVAEVARLAQYSDALEDQVAALREELGDAVDQARLFNRGGMSWPEYDRLLVRWEKMARA